MTVPAGAPAPERSPARAIGWALLYLAGGLALTIALATGGIMLSGGYDPAAPPGRVLLMQTLAGLVSFGLMTWAIGMRALRYRPADLRWAPAPAGVRGFGGGLLLGGGAAAGAIVLSLVAAGASFLPDQGNFAAYLSRVGATMLMLAPAALLEEVMFRGVAQVVLARTFGRVQAIVALSVLFALAHARNPNTTTLGLVNIALAGIFLGAAFYMPGGLWTAWGAHLGWNAALAAADAPVSGLPFPIPWINYQPGGPPWLTGGTFGPEGGLLATLMILAATAAAWRRTAKETV